MAAALDEKLHSNCQSTKTPVTVSWHETRSKKFSMCFFVSHVKRGSSKPCTIVETHKGLQIDRKMVLNKVQC